MFKRMTTMLAVAALAMTMMITPVKAENTAGQTSLVNELGDKEESSFGVSTISVVSELPETEEETASAEETTGTEDSSLEPLDTPELTEPETTQIPVEKITISGKETVSVKYTAKLTAEVSPAEATNQKLLWSTSNSSIAKVSQDGTVTGVKTGTVTITAIATDSYQVRATFKIRVCIQRPKNVKVRSLASGEGKVRISWSKVAVAKKYYIERKKSGGSWKHIATVKTLTYTDTVPSGNSTYRYRVTAIASNTKYNSRTSAVVKITIPKRPYGCKISSITSKGIEFYWKKPDNVDGYVVYRAYSEYGAYKKIAVIRSASTGTYLDSKFNTSRRHVYYKVRAYSLDANGKKVYSIYSRAKEASYRTSLTLERTTVYMRSGARRKLAAYYGWGNAKGVTWSTSNSSVARVSSGGSIRAVKTGTAYITCRSSSLGVSKRCKVVVNRSPLEPLTAITSAYTRTSVKNNTWKKEDASDKEEAVIMMTGDMMCTGSQQSAGGYATGNFNFNESYYYVKKLLSSADLAVGNLETLLSSTWPYMHDEAYIDNKPNCNAPSRYLDAVRYAGFDAVVTGNNHNCDAGTQGILETHEQIDKYQLPHTGTFDDSDDARYMILNVNGIKVGYLSYVSPLTGYNGKDSTWSNSEINTMLNYYTKAKAKKDIQAVREAGAEYVIVYMHWGVKNAGIKATQVTEAQELADLGVDYIVGSHCHLIQKYTLITASDGHQVPCFYSLGDFQSSIDQITGNRDTVILRIRLKRDEDGNIVLAENGYIPCYNYTTYQGRNYPTIPLNENLNGGLSLTNYTTLHNRIVAAVGNEIEEYKG